MTQLRPASDIDGEDGPAHPFLPRELVRAGEISSAGAGRWALLFDRLAVTAQYWTEHGPDGDEIGVRVEIQEVESRPGASEFDAAELLVHAPVWRADLFTLATGPAGNWDRAHFHPRFEARDPGNRTWDEQLTAEPRDWLAARLGDLRPLFAAGGRPGLADLDDAHRIEAAAPLVLAAVGAMLAQVCPRSPW